MWVLAPSLTVTLGKWLKLSESISSTGRWVWRSHPPHRSVMGIKWNDSWESTDAGIACLWAVQKVILVLTVGKHSLGTILTILESSSFKIQGILKSLLLQHFPSWLQRRMLEADRVFSGWSTRSIQGFMFQKVWTSWNFYLPSATPSLILEMDLKSHFEILNAWPLSSLECCLLLFMTWALDLVSLELGLSWRPQAHSCHLPCLASWLLVSCLSFFLV